MTYNMFVGTLNITQHQRLALACEQYVCMYVCVCVEVRDVCVTYTSKDDPISCRWEIWGNKYDDGRREVVAFHVHLAGIKVSKLSVNRSRVSVCCVLFRLLRIWVQIYNVPAKTDGHISHFDQKLKQMMNRERKSKLVNIRNPKYSLSEGHLVPVGRICEQTSFDFWATSETKKENMNGMRSTEKW